MIALIEGYKQELIKANVRSQRISNHHTLANCTVPQILSHALYLIEHFPPTSLTGKSHRQLAAVQGCFSFAGWYSLGDLKNHRKAIQKAD